ncbi:hypothetical protein B0H14DRAFT_2573257 [Mycena olivaceomarginata]|nr:hypothetical protein B0H14DRAFT_2573257 [Mycena olivaceomarginata]
MRVAQESVRRKEIIEWDGGGEARVRVEVALDGHGGAGVAAAKGHSGGGIAGRGDGWRVRGDGGTVTWSRGASGSALRRGVVRGTAVPRYAQEKRRGGIRRGRGGEAGDWWRRRGQRAGKGAVCVWEARRWIADADASSGSGADRAAMWQDGRGDVCGDQPSARSGQSVGDERLSCGVRGGSGAAMTARDGGAWLGTWLGRWTMQT